MTLTMVQQLNASAILVEGRLRGLSLDTIRDVMAQAFDEDRLTGARGGGIYQSPRFTELFDRPRFTELHSESLPVVDGFLTEAQC